MYITEGSVQSQETYFWFLFFGLHCIFLKVVKEFVRTLPSQAILCRMFMFTQQESISVGYISRQRPPGQRSSWSGTLPDRDPPEGTWDQGQRLPRRNRGPGSQTGSDIIQRPPCGQNDRYFRKYHLAPNFVCGLL